MPLRDESVKPLSYYYLLILHGLTCDAELGALPLVREQMQADFCPSRYPLRPACVTHQMIGMRFMQDRIARKLTWDPRPVDVYLQRVLDAQLDDGGWAGFYPLPREFCC